MPERAPHPDEDEAMAATRLRESPQHGFRGQPERAGRPAGPLGLAVALSRETGARGTTIARRVGVKLGWQVYTQDLIEYVCQEGTFRQDALGELPPAAAGWVEDRLGRLRADRPADDPTVLDLARVVLALAAQGEVVLLGRGAGCILPPASTLNVRLVAPLADRVAYVSEWLRLSEAEAAEEVRQRDRRRAEFLATHFGRQPGDVHQYDLVLNTSLLGEERCAELIVQAARGKHAALLEALRG